MTKASNLCRVDSIWYNIICTVHCTVIHILSAPLSYYLLLLNVCDNIMPRKFFSWRLRGSLLLFQYSLTLCEEIRTEQLCKYGIARGGGGGGPAMQL